VDILVARSDIGVGRAVRSDDLSWSPWPVRAAGPIFIRRTERPNAVEELQGAVARSPFVAGEPIRVQKLILAGGSGFLSAMLPAGMRALSTEITVETGAGGFILPNDHVDVILSRRDKDGERGGGGGESHFGEIILANVRVLAIDQTVEEKHGQRVVVGKTATLELSPQQAETLARAKMMGSLTLALRSIVDFGATDIQDDNSAGRRINTIRYGVSTTTISK
jgi:pilus assembly protein CpaB